MEKQRPRETKGLRMEKDEDRMSVVAPGASVSRDHFRCRQEEE